MYPTIKAEIEHGRIIPLENASLPDSCRVLVTILTPENEKMPAWKEVKKHLGFMRRAVNGKLWQKQIRSEWETRKCLVEMSEC
jgi:hypothetical protein